MFEISKSSLYELYKETENVAVDTLISGVNCPGGSCGNNCSGSCAWSPCTNLCAATNH